MNKTKEDEMYENFKKKVEDIFTKEELEEMKKIMIIEDEIRY